MRSALGGLWSFLQCKAVATQLYSRESVPSLVLTALWFSVHAACVFQQREPPEHGRGS